ncbi:MAG: DegT/DnrJ/EryC1/StrS family aminotransferase [Kofleriaceae bacterium]
MEKLKLKGGTPVRDEPLPRWPAVTAEQAALLVERLTGGPWALGQLGCPPGGVQKTELERELAALVGTKHALAVSSGTTALDLAIEALELPAGGVVVASSYGHPATIQRAAASHELLLLDIDPQFHCLDPAQVARALERGDVRCVLTTHFAGQPGGIEELRAMCRAAGVPLVEDASHAHGAALASGAVGSFGTLGAFSLHATKNLPAAEGGVLTTDDTALYERLWELHDLGRKKGVTPYEFSRLAGNHRMSELHAGLALLGLPSLLKRADARRRRVGRLRQALLELPGLELLPEMPGLQRHAYHIVAARHDPSGFAGLSRQRVILALCAEGIPVNGGWPRLISAVPGARERCRPHDTPVATRAVAQSIWFDARLFDDDRATEQTIAAVGKLHRLADTLRGGRA